MCNVSNVHVCEFCVVQLNILYISFKVVNENYWFYVEPDLADSGPSLKTAFYGSTDLPSLMCNLREKLERHTLADRVWETLAPQEI